MTNPTNPSPLVLQKFIAEIVANEPVSALVADMAHEYYGWDVDLPWSEQSPEQRQLAWVLYKGYRWRECECCFGDGQAGDEICEPCSGDGGEFVKV